MPSICSAREQRSAAGNSSTATRTGILSRSRAREASNLALQSSFTPRCDVKNPRDLRDFHCTKTTPAVSFHKWAAVKVAKGPRVDRADSDGIVIAVQHSQVETLRGFRLRLGDRELQRCGRRSESNSTLHRAARARGDQGRANQSIAQLGGFSRISPSRDPVCYRSDSYLRNERSSVAASLHAEESELKNICVERDE